MDGYLLNPSDLLCDDGKREEFPLSPPGLWG